MRYATRFLITLCLLLPAGAGVSIARDDESDPERAIASSDADEHLYIRLEAPLTSPFFADTPVALVNEEPITFRDLTKFIASTHAGRVQEATEVRRNYAELLDRIITTELIVQEARNIGFDELPDFVGQVDAKSTKLLMSMLMSRQLESVDPDPAELDELYKQMSREFLMATVNFANEADAVSFKDRVDSGDDFTTAAKSFTEEGRATLESAGSDYMKLKDFLPRIAEAVYGMKNGEVSQIFSGPKGFLVFQVMDVRFYEDPDVLEEARQTLKKAAQREASTAYVTSLEEKHSTVDKRLLEKVDFEREKTGFLSLGSKKPVDFEKLLKDERVVATVHSEPPLEITVADLARDVKNSLFHGVDKAVERREELNEKKQVHLRNMLFKRTAVLEARVQGLDQTRQYSDAMEDFEKSLLFETFVKRVVMPDIELTEAEIRDYYQKNIDDYKSPKMFRMNGLAFHDSTDAQSALGKLRRRADFKWVSANSPGQVDRGTKGVLDFGNVLLSLTALPEPIRKDADRARSGDALLYSAPGGYHYVISIDKIFPPAPQPYESVRETIGKIIADEKMRVLIDDWSGKLREAYDTEIFVKGLAE